MWRSFYSKRLAVPVLIIALLMQLGLPLFALAQLTHTFVGLSPSTVEESSLLRGRPVKKTVNLQRDLSELPLTLEVSYEGVDGRFLRGPEFVEFPVGVKQTTFTFEIYPEGAATGDYTALVNFLPALVPDEVGGGTGFGIRRGVALKVDFSVTDKEVIDYEIGHTELRQTEESLPIFFEYEVTNRGNVEWRPDSVTLSFTSPLTGQKLDDIIINEDMLEFAEPGGSTRVSVEVEHELPPGNYDVDISFTDEGETVYATTSSMIVFEDGTLQQSAQLVSLVTNKERFRVGENIRLTATLANIGDITTAGVLITEVYTSDGELIDILTSPQRTVTAGEQVAIDQIINLPNADFYKIEGYVEYAGSKVTERLSISVPVDDTLLSSNESIIPLILLGAAAVLFIAVIIYLISKFLKRKKMSAAPSVGMQPPSAPTPTPTTPMASPTAQPSMTPSEPQRPVEQNISVDVSKNSVTPSQAPIPTQPMSPPSVPVSRPVQKESVIPPMPPQARTVVAPPPPVSPPVTPTQRIETKSGLQNPSAQENAPLPSQVNSVPRPPLPSDDDDDLWTISL